MPEAKRVLLTSREAALFLRVGRTKLRELTCGGDIPAYRLGDGRTSPLRYKETELIAWLDRNRIDTTRPRGVENPSSTR